MTASLLGGLGLFLLGMVLLTDGLKALAGEALRGILTRFVSGPATGVAWGALVTALVQSSTATTLATVGFVSAGLLTFPQAVGVIFGANLGTTSTGWIVSQLGFKVSLGAVSPPLVLLGVVLRLLSRGRTAHAGTALAGFGLLFIGIDMLQGGMGALAARLSPGDLPGAGGDSGLAGRAILTGFGALMTVVMQSSSASMATTLAAVASGAINLEQAAAMLIGQNIGTTPTAVAAAMGAPAAAKRTALAHVLFNGLTAVVAFLALPWMLAAIEFLLGADETTDAPTVLAAFHTFFNVLGVAILLPLTGPFAALITRIVPERSPRSIRFLAPAVAEVGPIALEAARRAVAEVVAAAAHAADRVLRRRGLDVHSRDELTEADRALGDVRRFVHRLAQGALEPHEVEHHAALLHACDHAARLIDALRDLPANGDAPLEDPVVRRACEEIDELIARVASTGEYDVKGARPAGTRPAAELVPEMAPAAETASLAIAAMRKDERRAALAAAAGGDLDPDVAVARVDTLLWLDRVAYHLWRAAHHLRATPHGGAAALSSFESPPVG